MARNISLILGSGGARGLAHIGVIHELESRGFAIGAVVGCSVGALIGGCYCAGKLDVYEDWVRQLTRWDVFRFLDISLTSRAGMMKGDSIMNTLRDLIGHRRIEDLPLSFTAVATEIMTKKERWLDRGDLFDVIHASCAIPGIVTPKRIEGCTFVDGGLLNPLPVAPATDDGTDMTIAVSLAGPGVAEPFGPEHQEAGAQQAEGHRSQINEFLARIQSSLGMEIEQKEEEVRELGLTDVLIGTFDTMQSAITRYRLAAYPPDLLIEIPHNICEVHEFHKANELIDAGRHWAQLALEQHKDRFA